MTAVEIVLDRVRQGELLKPLRRFPILKSAFSRATVAKAAREGRLPATRIGGNRNADWLTTESIVLEFLSGKIFESAKIEPPAPAKSSHEDAVSRLKKRGLVRTPKRGI